MRIENLKLKIENMRYIFSIPQISQIKQMQSGKEPLPAEAGFPVWGHLRVNCGDYADIITMVDTSAKSNRESSRYYETGMLRNRRNQRNLWAKAKQLQTTSFIESDDSIPYRRRKPMPQRSTAARSSSSRTEGSAMRMSSLARSVSDLPLR